MTGERIYSDKLVDIFEDVILVKNCLFPFGDMEIPFGTIESITVCPPSLLTGKYRFYGTGDFRTWFPPDNRLARDKIFIIRRKKRWWRIGLTVENSPTVLELIKKRCRVIETC